MKRILVFTLSLLTLFGSQTSAMEKSKVKKTLSKVCTKVLPAVAVTAGVGFLAKAIYDNFQKESERLDDSTQKESERVNTTIPKETFNLDSNKEIRYIKWHGNMCWFNASVLKLYNDDFYREKLLNFNAHEKSEKNVNDKEAMEAISSLIKKIKNSKDCKVIIEDREYEEILIKLKSAKIISNDNNFGATSGAIYTGMHAFINRYFDLKGNETETQNPEKSKSIIVYSNGHYYNLYYDTSKNRLYSIGMSIRDSSAIKILKEDDDLYKAFMNRQKETLYMSHDGYGYYTCGYYIYKDNKLMTMNEYYASVYE
ncbi:MAG: hypothetical protein ACI4PR_01300 [Acutalibacteraceae bacterium]